MIFKNILPFWDYTVITSFPFPFLPPNTPVYPFWLALKSWPLLSLMVVICNTPPTHTHIHTRICKYNLFIQYNVTCMFAGMTICYWAINWYVLPHGELLHNNGLKEIILHKNYIQNPFCRHAPNCWPTAEPDLCSAFTDDSEQRFYYNNIKTKKLFTCSTPQYGISLCTLNVRS